MGFQRVIAGVGAVLYLLVGIGTGLFETFLIPIRRGTTYVPITVVFAVLSCAALVWLARQVNGSGWIAAMPLIGWVVAFVAMNVSGPGGDVLVPAGNWMQWIALGMLLAGLVSGVVTLSRTGATVAARSKIERQAAGVRQW
jgi:hypothetical protein